MLQSFKKKVVKDAISNKEELISIIRKNHFTTFYTEKADSQDDIINSILGVIKSYGKEDIKCQIYNFKDDCYFVVLGEESYEASDSGNTMELAEWEGIYYEIAERLGARNANENQIKMLEEI